ncbi:hypothetical protein [Streptomyces sp. C8S0]|uniref:hypothetical protein n=1 Tax=Streptomyces sp. C8S0 TaxID=2585716 RepID=UPI001D036F30|nr:hypothetical protein [Streptomyces sp. C8S0]
MLEESRAERAHLGRRPGDRPYLRSSAKTLILEDFANQPASDPWQAAMAAGLVLARRDAGILDPDETEPLQQVVEGILGPDTLDTLASIWTAAHATGDEDGQTMLEHARAWCQALATEPHQPEPTPMPQGSVSSELAEAISKSPPRWRPTRPPRPRRRPGRRRPHRPGEGQGQRGRPGTASRPNSGEGLRARRPPVHPGQRTGRSAPARP